MQQYTYLLVNSCAVVVCFIFSFDKRIRFDRHFGAFACAAILAAIPFLAWDIWFTAKGVWWFTKDYTVGTELAGLPVEEWLFFLCIPFSCTFTYFCLTRFFRMDWAAGFNNMIAFTTCVGCTLFALLYNAQLYTLVTAVATPATMIYLHFFVKAQWIGKASFIYLCLMPGFFLVNGILTGTGLEAPIVNYNPDEILNLRMLTIPVEDAVYGYTQFMWVIYFYKIFSKRLVSTEKGAGVNR